MIFENVYLFTKSAEQKGYGYEFIEIIALGIFLLEKKMNRFCEIGI